MIDPEELESNHEFELMVRSTYSIRDPDQLFIERLQKELAGRFKELQQSTESKKKDSERSPWLDRRRLQFSLLAWGAIGIIFFLLLVWGIKNLIPKIEPIGVIRTTPAPSIIPTKVPVQTEATEGEKNLPTIAGVPVPWPEEAISTEDASQITELAHWGKETINAVAWAPDGKSFAVASSTSIYFYDSSTFNWIKTINIGSSVDQIVYSPDGTKLALGINDTSVKIWDIASGSELLMLTGLDNFIVKLAFSPDGEILAAACYQTSMKLWYVNSGLELPIFSGAIVVNFAFSPDGTMLATTGGDDKTVRLWDVVSGQELRNFTGHSDYVYGLAFSPDGTILASSSNDMTIKLWEAATGNELRTLIDQDIPSGVAFSPDGYTLLSVADGGPITLWDVNRGEVLRTVGQSIRGSIQFSPDGKVALQYGYQSDEIVLLDISSGEERRALAWQSYLVTSVAISPDGSMVAVGLDSGFIKLLNATNGQELRTLTGYTRETDIAKSVLSLAFSPAGSLLASSSRDGMTELWDVASGEEQYSMESVTVGWVGGSPSVDFSPDGKLLAYAGPLGQVKVWDVTNHIELRTLGGAEGDSHPDEVMAVAFSPDGKMLASGYAGGAITLWDALSGQELRTLTKKSYSYNAWARAIAGMEFSPDGTMLVAGNWDYTLTWWDMATGSEIRTRPLPWSGDTAFDMPSLIFSPDGSVLAIAGGFRSISLLDAITGNELVTLSISATGLAFSPDGKLLISGGYDGAVRLWGMAPGSTIQQEAIIEQSGEEISPTLEPSPLSPSEDIDIEKMPLPILLTAEDLQPGEWSTDGSYFYYSEQGPIGEPGPDQAVITISFLDARTGEICEGTKETVEMVDEGWGFYPKAIDLYERARWLSSNQLLYLSPAGELKAITPCGGSTGNFAAPLPDVITSLTFAVKEDGSQIVLKGEQAYWLFTPSTRQYVKLNIPLPDEGMLTSLGWLPGDEQLYTCRIEEGGGLWIVIESVDPATGAASPIYEVQASPELSNWEPKMASIDWIDKDLMVIYDTVAGGQIIDLSSQPVQSKNLFPDLFGFEMPPMGSIMAEGVIRDSGRQDYHLILQTGKPDERYTIYHAESGLVDQYPLDPPLLVVFPSGEGSIVYSYGTPPSDNIFRVILVDSSKESFDLVAKGHTTGMNPWSFATIVPGGKQVLFHSLQGISLVDLETGEILNFWGLEKQEDYQDFNAMLAPDGKTVVGFASLRGAPGEGSSHTQAVYWLRLEP